MPSETSNALYHSSSSGVICSTNGATSGCSSNSAMMSGSTACLRLRTTLRPFADQPHELVFLRALVWCPSRGHVCRLAHLSVRRPLRLRRLAGLHPLAQRHAIAERRLVAQVHEQRQELPPVQFGGRKVNAVRLLERRVDQAFILRKRVQAQRRAAVFIGRIL